MSDTPTKKPRVSKKRIHRVEDDAASGGFYYATSTTQAKSMAVNRITAREATAAEIMDIGRRGLAVFGMEDQVVDDSQPELHGITSQVGAGGAPQIQDHKYDDDHNGTLQGPSGH